MASVKDTIDRLRRTSSFGTWISRYDELARAEIAAYLARRFPAGAAESRAQGSPSKAVKDALWGMIDLDYAELVVLDSPPLQRLRRVRQLGFSYLTYPTAGYSRFEHVLGVTFQAERMLRSIERRSSPEVRQAVIDAIPIARLAGLLHDVGHLPGSHLGERYYDPAECSDEKLLEEIQSALTDIADTLAVPKPALGEALSLAVILAPSMWGLLADYAGYTTDQIAAAAMAIVGAPPSVQQAFLPNIITNVIDADKLDYLFRDALVTQIPLAVDLDRLLYKLKVVQVPASKMGEALQSLATAGASCNVLGTDLTGYDLLYDLLASRSMLFDRIYLHHKTRAAERMGLDILDRVHAHPVELLVQDDTLFLTASADEAIAVGDDTLTAADRRRRLRERDLPRRAFAISYEFLVAQARGTHVGKTPVVEEEQQDALKELIDTLDERRERGDLLEAITAERQEIARILDRAEPLPELWLDTQPKSNDPGDPDLFVELPDGDVRNRDSYAQKASAFTRSPMRSAYLYSSGSDQDLQLANIAAEVVIFERYGLLFGRHATDYAKVDHAEVSSIKRRLEAVEPTYFDSRGPLRPASAMVASELGRSRISGLVQRFHAYNVGDTAGSPSMSAERLETFLHQFPEELVLPMLEVLAGVTFLTRDELGTQLAGVLTPPDGATSALAVFPMTTDPEKSAASLGAYFADSADRPPLVGSIHEALTRVRSGAASSIASIDDFCLSGEQAGTVVQIWMGEEDLLLPEERHLATELSAEDKELLRSTPLTLGFVFSTADGRRLLEEVGTRLGLSLHIATVLDSADVTTVEQLTGAQSQRLIDFLSRVGASLLTSTKQIDNPEKWTDERVGLRRLGYGNKGLLVVQQNNCPTSTVTALWSGGEFRGTAWTPLFPRRSTDQSR